MGPPGCQAAWTEVIKMFLAILILLSPTALKPSDDFGLKKKRKDPGQRLVKPYSHKFPNINKSQRLITLVKTDRRSEEGQGR